MLQIFLFNSCIKNWNHAPPPPPPLAVTIIKLIIIYNNIFFDVYDLSLNKTTQTTKMSVGIFSYHASFS